MREALAEAERAASRGEIPVGAVIVRDGEIIARAGNTREQGHDPTGHAEINVIRAACEALGNWRLTGCTLYVTLEPCPMCAGAILAARLERVVFGASDPDAGCLGSRIHLFDIGFANRPWVKRGVLEEECTGLLRSFFRERRQDSGF